MPEDQSGNEFEAVARAGGGDVSFLAEIWGFARQNKKWWILPILAVLLVLGLLIALSSTAVAPFIYTLF